MAASRTRIGVAVALLAEALLGGGCHGKPEIGPTATVGELTVAIETDPAPATVGHDNTLRFRISNAGGPLSGAMVAVTTRFLGLNRDGPTGEAFEASPGVYEWPGVSTAMAGKWSATVTVTPPGGSPQTATLGFNVAKEEE